MTDWTFAIPRNRRTPPTRKVLAYYGIVWDEPAFCFRCEETFDQWADLERAHLVDHAYGGLDGPQNLVMLCSACHRSMPTFVSGEGEAARAWVLHQLDVPAAPRMRRRRPINPDLERLAPIAKKDGDPVGLLEIADRLGVKRQTVAVWNSKGILPAPRWIVGGRPAWNWTPDITEWAEQTGRRQARMGSK